jgi:hypothetical protein
MRTIKYDGMGNLVHAKAQASKYLKDKKDGTEFRAIYLNGFAVFIKKKGQVIIK